MVFGGNSWGTKEFNHPPLVLKARHLSGSAFCMTHVSVPEQALGWIPLSLRLVLEDEPSKFSWNVHNSPIGLVFLSFSTRVTVLASGRCDPNL